VARSLANDTFNLGYDLGVQAGYMVLQKTLELAVRYSAIESTADNASDQFDKKEYQAGINYYFAKHNALTGAQRATFSGYFTQMVVLIFVILVVGYGTGLFPARFRV
jgi:hypothetical protein